MKALKEYLEVRLTEELPGKVAHKEVAPYRKLDFTTAEIQNARKSGVLVLFYERGESIYTILMQRNVYDGKHSGQVAFPGGKKEEIDKDIYATALREAKEEVGIKSSDVEVLGQLSNVFIPVSNFYVTPVVGMLHYVPDFIPDEREVDELIELPVENLLLDEYLQTTKIKMGNGNLLKTPAFVFNKKVVWGATALILNELKYILLERKS